MKIYYIVTLDIPSGFCIDPSSDEDAVKGALWEHFPHLPKDAIEVHLTLAPFSPLPKRVHNPDLIHPATAPCGRCGGQIVIMVPPPNNVQFYAWWCKRCGLKSPTYDLPTLGAAINDANRRAPTSPEFPDNSPAPSQHNWEEITPEALEAAFSKWSDGNVGAYYIGDPPSPEAVNYARGGFFAAWRFLRRAAQASPTGAELIDTAHRILGNGSDEIRWPPGTADHVALEAYMKSLQAGAEGDREGM